MLIGLLVGVTGFLSIFLGTDGTRPAGVCTFLEGEGGLLPLNPNEGGSIAYSCTPNWSLLLFYGITPGVGLALMLGGVSLIFDLMRE